ncbi:MAG TPA: aspartate/glutamate racemase family protein [Rhizomicrobium sp.]|jgi:aspartate racemase|nr:aspartate/glutamate racemase family protein [Rhizomicrobium sp.]
MKTIGMIGGMSWESSSIYYQLMNREVQKRVGGVSSAKTLMYSFDFGEMSALQAAGKWDEATDWMTTVGATLSKGGADFVMICCNTMHLMADDVEKAAKVPLLHIADPLGAKIRKDGKTRVGLIGSRFTMEDDRIIAGRLKDKFGIETITPEADDRAIVDRVIQEELVRGKFLEPSRALYRGVMQRLVERGAEGVILGCTEIPLLVNATDATVPLYDTTTLHALAAVDRALA